MNEEKTAGLLLQAIPYLGQKKILKVLSPELGLISIAVHRTKNTALATPFCLGEWVIRKKGGELYTFVDGSLVDGLLELKNSYAALTAAGQISSDLLKTQLPGKRSIEIFALTSAIFSKLPTFPHPEILVALFRIKYLTHEGLLSFTPCAVCQGPSRHLSRGESFCLSHARAPGWSFSEEEWNHLGFVAESRSFAALREQKSMAEAYRKLEEAFHETL